MAILAIDTAGPDCIVAVARPAGDRLDMLARRAERIGRGHAEALMPMVAATLAAAGQDFNNLQRIAVTVGPGSFTGIRVGVATARGLALALDVPAVGVGVLEALAHQARGEAAAGLVVAALDARRGEIFAFALEGATGTAILPPTAVTPDCAAARLTEHTAKGAVVLTGSGAALLQEALARRGFPSEVSGTAESADIAVVAELGWRAPANAPPRPVYLRSPDAKEQTGVAVARR